MLWTKAAHLFFLIAWFAGLFYLPRLYVYHCEVQDEVSHARFCTMERRLYVMTTLGLIGTWVFGVWTLLLGPQLWLHAGWLHAKLTLVVLLSAYHGWLKNRLRAFAQRRNDKSAKFYRVMNEVPSLLLAAIVILVVLKPF